MTFKDKLQRFRHNDPDVIKWWIEQIDMIADKVITPFVLLGFDTEDLKQEVFVIIYEKLRALDNGITGIGWLKDYTIRKLSSMVAQTYGVNVDKLTTELRYKRPNTETQMILALNDVINIHRVSNNLKYSDPFPDSLLKEQLVDILDTLTSREENVLRLRMGLDDGRQRTQKEIGRSYKVCGGQIGQIEAKALRKLRHPSRSKRLVGYLDDIDLIKEWVNEYEYSRHGI